MKKKIFGETSKGEKVYLYTLENSRSMKVGIINYGARVVSICVPGKNGRLYDVVLGYDTLGEYEKDTYCFGATIGRNANRIKNAEFVLNGNKYHLCRNENNNNCHSGPDGYEFRVWDGEIINDSEVRFSLTSPHLDQGFPGEFTVSVTYRLTEDNEIQIYYDGVSTEDTVVNMTHHSYFNLDGCNSGNVLNQYLRINAKEYAPIENGESIPTGVREAVEGTPMDFKSYKKIGEDINADFIQLKLAGDYNHSFYIDKVKTEMALMAAAYSKESGIKLEAFTDLPAVQFYAGFYINHVKGKENYIYESRSGFCLEAQYTPNAVNAEDEEKPILRKNKKYLRRIFYRFIYGNKNV